MADIFNEMFHLFYKRVHKPKNYHVSKTKQVTSVQLRIAIVVNSWC